MIDVSPEKREQAIAMIRLFCAKPFRDHGRKRSTGEYKGWFQHDWGHLAQRIYRIYYEQALDIPSATIVAKPLRSEFPNRGDWESRVNNARVQAHVLEVIEAGIAKFAPQHAGATESAEPAVANAV